MVGAQMIIAAAALWLSLNMEYQMVGIETGSSMDSSRDGILMAEAEHQAIASRLSRKLPAWRGRQ